MLLCWLIYTLAILVAALVIPGVRIKGGALGAVKVAAVFGVLNWLLGWLVAWLITLVSLPAIILTIGLFIIVIPFIVNAVLLKLTDVAMDSLEIAGLGPLLGGAAFMTFAHFIAHRLRAPHHG
jgi:putative membrane protein